MNTIPRDPESCGKCESCQFNRILANAEEAERRRSFMTMLAWLHAGMAIGSGISAPDLFTALQAITAVIAGVASYCFRQARDRWFAAARAMVNERDERKRQQMIADLRPPRVASGNPQA